MSASYVLTNDKGQKTNDKAKSNNLAPCDCRDNADFIAVTEFGIYAF